MEAVIPRQIVPSPPCSELGPRQVEREFRRLVDGGLAIRPAGKARRSPRRLLALGYSPKHKIQLFDTTYFVTNAFQNYFLRFFVAYVVQGTARAAHPRIFYKDASLIWRAASHVGGKGGELWVGKGDVSVRYEDGDELINSREETTDLPLEIQPALESLNRIKRRVPTDFASLDLILRRGPDSRIQAYRDFTEPRKRARSNPRNLINNGRPVAWFTRRHDPASLRFAPGFEPDFDDGVIEVGDFSSKIYGGPVERYRILSKNQRVQYLFFAGPRHVWIIPPQATTTQLSSFGVRTIDVEADEDIFIPGFEYHFLDDSMDPPAPYSQIPPGFAGPASESDPARADASPWLDQLPVVREFRSKLLGAGRDRARRARAER
ncbi:MAG: hypothetical protein ACHQ3O_09470 [Candidatus Limnocylindria bacterium]|jgi:hypothetical protein